MSDQLIDDYVRELRVSAWIRQLPKPRTAELERDVRERIATELATAGKRDEATVYSVLDRLGPASDFIVQQDAVPPSGARRAIHTVLAPFARVRFTLASRGWSAAEIGGLLLLMVGPFVLWWIGPILGIILVRAKSDRWSDRATHVATVIVFALLTVQVLLSVGLLLYVLAVGGSAGPELARLMAAFSPGYLPSHILSPASDFPLSAPLFVARIIGSLLAPIAGLASGIYLALSPRYRR